MSRHLAAALACLLWVAGCGEVESDPATCPPDPDELEKRWFVGELDTELDEPSFGLRITIVNVESTAPTLPAFAGKETQHTVRFIVTEDMLLAREMGDDPLLVAAFPIVHHRADLCAEPYNPPPFGDPPPPGAQPWYLRPWFRVDWSRNLGVGAYRFDAASASGQPEAASYEPVILDATETQLEMDADSLAVTTALRIEWEDIDDESPGCIYDFLHLPDGAACPDVRVELRYELDRLPGD